MIRDQRADKRVLQEGGDRREERGHGHEDALSEDLDHRVFKGVEVAGHACGHVTDARLAVETVGESLQMLEHLLPEVHPDALEDHLLAVRPSETDPGIDEVGDEQDEHEDHDSDVVSSGYHGSTEASGIRRAGLIDASPEGSDHATTDQWEEERDDDADRHQQQHDDVLHLVRLDQRQQVLECRAGPLAGPGYAAEDLREPVLLQFRHRLLVDPTAASSSLLGLYVETKRPKAPCSPILSRYPTND